MTDPQQQPTPVPPPVAPGYPAPPTAPPAYQAPGYQTSPGYQAAPGYQAPPGAFSGPAAGYAAPSAPAPQPARGSGVGRTALLLALLASVALTIVGAVLAWQIGHGIGASTDLATLEQRAGAGDLSILTPVRDLVLWVEITTWVATALGIWALVQGIVAIARRRGRGSGIAAVIIAVLGPFLYVLVGYFAFAIGLGVAAAQQG